MLGRALRLRLPFLPVLLSGLSAGLIAQLPVIVLWRGGFDPSVFSAPVPFTFGNSLRRGIRGGGIQTLDAATLSKEFALAEKFQANLRAEFYNLLNHANFELPGHVYGAANFATVLGARAARGVQRGLRVSF